MKRFLIIIILMIFLVGCSKNKNDDNSIKIIGYSDSISGASLTKESSELDNNIYTDKKETKHQIVKTNIGDIEADYVSTLKILYQYFEIKEYKDSDNNTFRVNDKGIITHYFWFKNAKDNTKLINESDALNIANEFISKFVDKEDYKISITFREDTEKYVIQYVKYIGDLKTSDEATIKIDKYGNLYDFESSFFGMIKKDVSLDFDYQNIENTITSKLDLAYESIKADYDNVHYNLNDYTLIMLDEDKYALIYSVDVRFEKKVK